VCERESGSERARAREIGFVVGLVHGRVPPMTYRWGHKGGVLDSS